MDRTLNIKAIVTLLAFGMMIHSSKAQVTLVKEGKLQSRIVISSEEKTDITAASILQDFVKRISGASLPIIKNQHSQKGDVIIGNDPHSTQIFSSDLPKLSEDGFLLSTENGCIHILSGGDKGSIYGVVTLLEQYLGVSYYGDHEYSLQPQKSIHLPSFKLIDNPAFRYRQSQCYATQDTLYKIWYRFELPSEVFAGGYWVHTFDKILPSSVYGKSHPEYYSYFNGERHPGNHSQWCLTNPEVFEIVSHKVDSIFKANPGKKIISISQNDGNFTNCTCDNCKKIDEEEGSPSGSIIYFLNKLAARFPDKEFSTLAYLYSMKPPKNIKPLPNVNIMLCDIDCKREVSLTENASGREFVKALEGWSKITNNIFVWDYGINFDNYVSPFPNFHILQDNIRLFKKYHATMHHSQIGGRLGSDFPELRAYMVSKLMWNPEVNADSLMQTFLKGYYGPAAPYVYQYIKIMEGAIIASGVPLWIYDSPVSHKNGMLKPALMKRYNALFDQAEEAVAKDETFLKRVRRSRLPLQYSELEIARTESQKDLQDIEQKLDLFEARTKEFNVPTLNERENPPAEYCKLYRERYMPRKIKSLAAGAKVIYINGPENKYKPLCDTALTDGLFGGSTYVESWVGWEGKDGSFIIDLGKEKQFSSVETDFLHQLGAWILLPVKVEYSYSSDTVNFTPWGTKNIAEDRSLQVKFVGVKQESVTPIKARYIKVEVTGTKVCPPWHYGVGHPSWFFIDEVTVL